MDVLDSFKVGSYFDALYRALANSPTHARIGREALGEGFVGQLGYADEEDLLCLAELAGMGKGRSVLDLCCGSGGTSIWFAQRITSRVTGLDCSRTGLQLGRRAAQATPEAQVSFVLGDIGSFPFRREQFDAVVCLDGFGTLFSKVFHECYRVLRTGGGLAFLLNVPQTPDREAEAELRRVGFVHVSCQVVSEHAAPTMERWLAAYKRHARPHIAEVGMYYHQVLTDEIEALLTHFRKGTVERLLLSGMKGG